MNNGIIYEQASLSSNLEEAIIRIVPHVASVVKNGLTQADVSSKNTNIFTLLLHHMHNLFSFGMEELCIKFGTDTNTLGWVEGLNIVYSMKYSTQSAKLDSLYC